MWRGDWRINKCQFTHVFYDVIFVSVSILLKLIFLSVYMCVFDEKWLQSVRNLSLERRHVFALCDLRLYTSLREHDDILSSCDVTVVSSLKRFISRFLLPFVYLKEF